MYKLTDKPINGSGLLAIFCNLDEGDQKEFHPWLLNEMFPARLKIGFKSCASFEKINGDGQKFLTLYEVDNIVYLYDSDFSDFSCKVTAPSFGRVQNIFWDDSTSQLFFSLNLIKHRVPLLVGKHVTFDGENCNSHNSSYSFIPSLLEFQSFIKCNSKDYYLYTSADKAIVYEK